MALGYSSLALLFQLVFFMYAPCHTYAVRNLWEKQQDTFQYYVVEEIPSSQLPSQRLSKELEDLYSRFWIPVNKIPSFQLPNYKQQLSKEQIEDLYSRVLLVNSINKIPPFQLPESQQLTKDQLESLYSKAWISDNKIPPFQLSSQQLSKELEALYSSTSFPDNGKNPTFQLTSSEQLTEKNPSSELSFKQFVKKFENIISSGKKENNVEKNPSSHQLPAAQQMIKENVDQKYPSSDQLAAQQLVKEEENADQKNPSTEQLAAQQLVKDNGPKKPSSDQLASPQLVKELERAYLSLTGYR